MAMGPSERPTTNYAGQVGWAVGMPKWLDSAESKVNRYWRSIEYGSDEWVGRRVVGLWGPDAEPRKGLWGMATTPFGAGSREKFAPYFKDNKQDMLGVARFALWQYLQGGKDTQDRLNAPPGGWRFMKTPHPRVSRRAAPAGFSGTQRMATPRPAEWKKAETPAQIAKAKKGLFHWFMTRATLEQLPFVQGVISRPIEAMHAYQEAAAGFPFLEREMDAIRAVFPEAMMGGKSQPQTPRQALSAVRKREQSVDRTPRTGVRKNVVTNANVGRYLPRANFQVAAGVTTQSLIFDKGGKFGTGQWQGQLREINERIAMEYQRAVADVIKSQGRSRPSTNALEEATRDPRNRYPRDVGGPA